MQVSHELVYKAPMEHLNKVELVGNLWTVNIQECGNTRCAKLCIYTEYCYTSQEGMPVIETTWHYITAWESEDIKNLDQLKVGSTIHIVGRLRVRKRTKATGEERTVHDIIANKVETL